MSEKNITLYRPNTFKNQILIVDGQGRSGKNLIAVLLSTVSKIEKMRLDSQLDYIPRYFYLNKMEKDAAVIALQTEFDEKYYYNSISRDVNFRFSDYSSVWKQGIKFKYFKRLFLQADDAAINRLNIEQPIFQNMTHDALHIIDIFFEALDERVKFIHVLRDPVGNIYEQNLRNFGSRIGSDPREFQLTYSFNDEVLPIMALGFEDLYITGNPLEKLVITVNAMFTKNMEKYSSLDRLRKSQILFIDFDDFVINPFEYLENMEKFIGVKFPNKSTKLLKREDVPRRLNNEVRKKRIEEIELQIRPIYLNIFRELVERYNSKPWSL